MSNDELTRRDFVGMTVAAGLAAAAGADVSAQQVVEQNVEIKTPDGTCDAAFIHPSSGRSSGRAHLARCVRPAAVDARHGEAAGGRRLLGARARTRSTASRNHRCRGRVEVQFADPAAAEAHAAHGLDSGGRHRGTRCVRVRGLARHAESRSIATRRSGRRATAWAAPLVVRTAATVPERIGAGASFHGGGLVTRSPEQPASARAEDQGRGCTSGSRPTTTCSSPMRKTKLKEAFDAAKVPAEVEVYSMAQHGWCVPDMPAGANGSRSTTRPTPNAPGPSSWRCTRPRSCSACHPGRTRVTPSTRSNPSSNVAICEMSWLSITAACTASRALNPPTVVRSSFARSVSASATGRTVGHN